MTAADAGSHRMSATTTPARHRFLQFLAILGLAIDAAVHLHLAARYDPIGTAITQGALFRAEAAAAFVAAALLALRDRRLCWLLAGAVAAAGLAAILVTRYLAVPALGPVPNMHDPVWFPEKALVAAAMLLTTVSWLAREVLHRRVVRHGGSAALPRQDHALPPQVTEAS